jgi:PAS domain S-box-containing protein
MQIEYQKELEKIKKIIQGNKRGTTIKEISKKIGINRNVVVKYLDVLQISGEIEVEKFGRSKVYFPSHSIPLSNMFDYSHDFIVVVRKDMTTVEINNPFIRYLGLENKEDIIGKHITKLPFAQHYPQMTNNILSTLSSKEFFDENIKNQRINSSKTDTFHVRYIPTTLNDGEQGVTIIISKTS